MQLLKLCKTNSESKIKEINLKIFNILARLRLMAESRSRALSFVAKRLIEFMKVFNLNGIGDSQNA